MSNKDKKFQPDAGFVVAVHQNILGIRAVASALDVFPEALAEAMATMGFQFIPNPCNLSHSNGVNLLTTPVSRTTASTCVVISLDCGDLEGLFDAESVGAITTPCLACDEAVNV